MESSTATNFADEQRRTYAALAQKHISLSQLQSNAKAMGDLKGRYRVIATQVMSGEGVRQRW